MRLGFRHASVCSPSFLNESTTNQLLSRYISREVVHPGAAGATSKAETSGSSLSYKTSWWETAKSVAEASWKELTGQKGYTSSFREAGEAASSHLTPDSVAGVIAMAQAKPAGVAAGAVAVGSVASPIWEAIRTAAANGWPVGRTLLHF